MAEAKGATSGPDLGLIGAEHVKRYRETNGEVGHIWNGATALILTTIGRKSGEPRSQPLIYGRDWNNYVVIASYGGAPQHPAWYGNLVAHSDVEIQVKDKLIRGRAHTVQDETERARLWEIMATIWPAYDRYVARTKRTIPVVVITPNDVPTTE